MAKYPGAVQRPLAKTMTQSKMSRYDAVVLHTMVGNLSSTDSMFHSGGYSGTESHFGVGGIWGGDADKDYDGEVFQWVDTDYRADANLEGNPRIISIETADNAPRLAKDIKPWTNRQIEAIVGIVAWACRTHDIPAVLMTDSKPGSRGIGYHRLGCTHSDGAGSHPGFRVSGGEVWSNAVGKECPGTARIEQIKTIIVPRVQAALRGETVPDPYTAQQLWGQPIEMTAADAKIYNADLAEGEKPKKAGDTLGLGNYLRYPPSARRLLRDVDGLSTDLTATAKSLTTGLANVTTAIGALAARFSAVEARLSALETIQTTLAATTVATEAKVTTLGTDVASFREAVGADFISAQNELEDGVADIIANIRALEHDDEPGPVDPPPANPLFNPSAGTWPVAGTDPTTETGDPRSV
jgi:hypothetical protein